MEEQSQDCLPSTAGVCLAERVRPKETIKDGGAYWYASCIETIKDSGAYWYTSCVDRQTEEGKQSTTTDI